MLGRLDEWTLRCVEPAALLSIVHIAIERSCRRNVERSRSQTQLSITRVFLIEPPAHSIRRAKAAYKSTSRTRLFASQAVVQHRIISLPAKPVNAVFVIGLGVTGLVGVSLCAFKRRPTREKELKMNPRYRANALAVVCNQSVFLCSVLLLDHENNLHVIRLHLHPLTHGLHSKTTMLTTHFPYLSKCEHIIEHAESRACANNAAELATRVNELTVE